MSKVARSQRTAQQFNGREGETATFFFSFFFHIIVDAGGFAPRHLSRSAAFPINQVVESLSKVSNLKNKTWG